MPLTLPLPYPSGGDLVALMIFNNNITLGLFGNMIIAALFAVVFITLMGANIKKAFLAASATSFLLSIPLAALTVVGAGIPVLMLALTAVSLIPIFFEGG